MNKQILIGFIFMLLLLGSLFILTAGLTGTELPKEGTSIEISKTALDKIGKDNIITTELVCGKAKGSECKAQVVNADDNRIIGEVIISKCNKKIFGYCIKEKDTKQLEEERNIKIKKIIENKYGVVEDKGKENVFDKILEAVKLVFK